VWVKDKSKKGRLGHTKGVEKGAIINNYKSNNMETSQEIFLSESVSAYDVCRRGTRECGGGRQKLARTKKRARQAVEKRVNIKQKKKE